MKKETVGPGKFVAYSYKVYDEADGKVLFEAREDAPDVMVVGASEDVIPGLIAAMDGLGEGDRFDITLPPAAAFGEVMPDNIVELDRSIFERDGKLAEEVSVGAELPMMTAEGYRIMGKVLDITDKAIKMDFNHPFAGKTVRFEGTVQQVRQATPEEMNPSHGGCGGCCGGCGDDHGHDHDHDNCGGCGSGCCH